MCPDRDCMYIAYGILDYRTCIIPDVFLYLASCGSNSCIICIALGEFRTNNMDTRRSSWTYSS